MKLLTLIAVSTLVLVTGCCSIHQAADWQYRVVRGTAYSADLEAKLNQAGLTGFEVVSSETLPGKANGHPETIVILKKVRR